MTMIKILIISLEIHEIKKKMNSFSAVNFSNFLESRGLDMSYYMIIIWYCNPWWYAHRNIRGVIHIEGRFWIRADLFCPMTCFTTIVWRNNIKNDCKLLRRYHMIIWLKEEKEKKWWRQWWHYSSCFLLIPFQMRELVSRLISFLLLN